MTFGTRLASAMRERGPLCVGIDPDPETLERWGLADTPASLASFSAALLDAADGAAAAVKPNAAFFERHGSRGIAVLEELLGRARQRSLLTILDAKRGDIGSTMAGYAQAFLAPGAPLEADSLTVSAYLGFGSLKPALDLAIENRKGLFVLALTSNPEGASVQHARDADGVPVARKIAQMAAGYNAGASPMGSIGLVVGATVGSAVADLGIDLAAVNGALLSPGVGAQGAGPRELEQVFGSARSLVLVNQSRGIAHAGPDPHDLRGAVQAAVAEARDALRLDDDAPQIPTHTDIRR